MLYQPPPPDRSAVELAAEIGRARRIVLSLSDPKDLVTLEAYIAELELRQSRGVVRAPLACA